MKHISGKGAATDSIFLAGVRLITMLTGIVSTMLLTHKLSLIEYGTYTQGNIIISVSISLSIFGLSDAVNFFYNGKRQEEQQRYVNTVFMIEMITGILAAFIIFIFRQSICDYFGNAQLMGLFLYIAFRPLLDNMTNTLQVLQVSIGRAKVLAMRNLILSLARIALVLITTLLTGNIRTIFIGYVVLDVITVAYFWTSFSSRTFPIHPLQGIWNLVPTVLKYSLPMAVYSLTKSLLKDMDKLVIGRFEGTQSVAIYANCAYALPFDVISNAFLVVMIPIITRYIARAEYSQGKKLFADYIRIGYMTTCVFASAVLILAPEMIIFLFGEKYLPGLAVFVLYLMVDMIKFVNLSLVLSAKGWTRILMVISLVSLGMNYVLNLLFYKVFGFIGPAAASVLVSVLTTCVLCHYSAKALEARFSQLINWKEILLITSELLILALPCVILRDLLRNQGFGTLLIIIIVGAAYIGTIMLLNYKRIFGLLRSMNMHKIEIGGSDTK